METSDSWEKRLVDLWDTVDDLDPDEFRIRMSELTDELPGEHPVGDFERAASFDSTGHSDKAAPLYRRALANGLQGIRRRRAVIQMASSLRNLGALDESFALLELERTQPSDELDDAVAAFYALVLADRGREREALSIALKALARHLPRYQRSVVNYAKDLTQ